MCATSATNVAQNVAQLRPIILHHTFFLGTGFPFNSTRAWSAAHPPGPPAHARSARTRPPGPLAAACSRLLGWPPLRFNPFQFDSIIKLQCLLLIHLLNNKFETYNCFISYHHYHYLLHLLLCHALLVHKPQC